MSRQNHEMIGLPDFHLPITAGWEMEEDRDLLLTMLDNRSLGVATQKKGDTTTCTFFHSGHIEGYMRWMGPLPAGISFEMARCDIRQLLGIPEATGEPSTGILGAHPAWDRFDRTSYFLHVQYGGPNGTIDLVTAMKPEFTPGR